MQIRYGSQSPCPGRQHGSEHLSSPSVSGKRSKVTTSYKFLLVVVAAGLCAGPVVTAAALALGTIPVLARAA